MKNLISTLTCFVLILLSVIACKKADSPQVYIGTVLDATMNNLTMITDKGDTINISTMDTNPQKVQGVLINDSVKVTCKSESVDGATMLKATELTILAHSPYYYIQGSWVEPNPINAKKVQGFTLKEDGTASSINMATLQFSKWSLNNQTLILSYTSIGNRETIEGTDTLNLVKIDADSLVLSSHNEIVWKLSRQK